MGYNVWNPMDVDFVQLTEYDPRIGQIYLNPRHVIDAPRPHQSTPYYVRNIPFTSAVMATYNAPTFGWKANMLYPTKNMRQHNYGKAAGQAPTQGIYTGLPSGCTAAGIPKGGNPYA